MKKIGILIIISTLFVSIIAFLAIKIQKNNSERNLFADELLSIPSIEVYDLNNKPLRLDSLCVGEKIIIVCFDTDCELCHIEAREFGRLQNEFEDSQVVFISNNTVDEINKFIIDNGLENSSYMFLNDRDFLLIMNYNIPTMPFMLLYIDNKLHNSYKGGINIEQIIKDKR